MQVQWAEVPNGTCVGNLLNVSITKNKNMLAKFKCFGNKRDLIKKMEKLISRACTLINASVVSFQRYLRGKNPFQTNATLLEKRGGTFNKVK